MSRQAKVEAIVVRQILGNLGSFALEAAETAEAPKSAEDIVE